MGYHCDRESELVQLCLTCTAPRCHGNCERYAEAAKAASTGWRGGRKPPRRYTYQHKRRTLAEWARITGVSEPSLRSRLKRGLTIAQAIEMGPAKRGGSRGPQYTAEGFTGTAYQWAERLGISYKTLLSRLYNNGRDIAEAAAFYRRKSGK